MNVHRSTIVVLFAVLALILLSMPAVVKAADPPPKTETSEQSNVDAKIARGKYLVHHVAQCIQCHTPRDDSGALIQKRLLQGAPIPITGPRYAQPWAAESAWIAGLGSYDESFVHYLLTRGRKPDGSRPKRPMPTFKMTDADAKAVIAYLRSL